MTTLEVNAIEYLYKEGDNEIEQAKSILNKLYLKKTLIAREWGDGTKNTILRAYITRLEV